MLRSWMTDDAALSRDELHALCMTFLTMGHENIATAVAWTVLLLAQNPACQERVRREVRAAAEGLSGDGAPRVWDARTLAALGELTDAFHEATRLYPSVPVLTRTATRDTAVLGFGIPAGTELVLNTYAAHRHEPIFGARATEWQLPGRRAVVSTAGPPDAFPFGMPGCHASLVCG